MTNGTTSRNADPKNWRLFFFSGGVIVLLWALALVIVILVAPTVSQAASIDAPKTFSDLATLLFGATSIALFILSLAISVLAIVGWGQIKQNIQEEVSKASAEAGKLLREETARVNRVLRDETAEANRTLRDDSTKLSRELREETTRVTNSLREDIERIAAEMRGRNLAIFGYMLGKLALQQDKPELKPGREELLSDAVGICDSAFELVEGTGRGAEFVALNNLVFFNSIYEATAPRPLPGRRSQSRAWLLAKARVLLAAVREHEDDGTPNSIPLLLTYCCAISLFSEREDELRRALGIVIELLGRDDVSEGQKTEARYYQASLQEKLRKLDERK